jgi:hypothetical protein
VAVRLGRAVVAETVEFTCNTELPTPLNVDDPREGRLLGTKTSNCPDWVVKPSQ